MEAKAGTGGLSRGMASREAILNAAVTVVGREGLPAASLGVIAREAGTSKPAVLYHFGSREKLLREMADRALRMALERVVQGGLEPGDPVQAARRLAEGVFSNENRQLMASVRELITLGIRDPVVGEAVNKGYDALAQAFNSLFPEPLNSQPHITQDLVIAWTGFVQRWLCSGDEDPSAYRAGALRVHARIAGLEVPQDG